MNHPKSPFIIRLFLIAQAILTSGTTLLQAEDVFVTSYLGDTLTGCPPSCAYDLDTAGNYGSVSMAVPLGPARTKTFYGSGTNAAWAVTPTLGTSTGVYRVYVSQGATYNCSPDLHVKLVATSGCTLADTNYVPRTSIDTTAFQQGASLNVWTLVAIITNSATTPTITFSYASGASNRWYMDEVRFENIATAAATPARITRILSGNPITITGTGPVGRPFALVSSANASKPLSQWTAEQTNTAGTGSFIFSITPGAGTSKFFRVLTQ
jgi:hypothetical protein